MKFENVLVIAVFFKRRIIVRDEIREKEFDKL